MASDPVTVELAIHRVENASVVPIGGARFHQQLPDTEVLDEEMLRIVTVDGGDAVVTGMGPGGREDEDDVAWSIGFGVRQLTPGLCEFINRSARNIGGCITHWHQEDGFRYEWEPHSFRGSDETYTVRSRPVAVYLAWGVNVALPSNWPAPIRVATARALYEAVLATELLNGEDV